MLYVALLSKEDAWRAVHSFQKTYRWLTNTWKDAQHCSLLRKCKSKLQWASSSGRGVWVCSLVPWLGCLVNKPSFSANLNILAIWLPLHAKGTWLSKKISWANSNWLMYSVRKFWGHVKPGNILSTMLYIFKTLLKNHFIHEAVHWKTWCLSLINLVTLVFQFI